MIGDFCKYVLIIEEHIDDVANGHLRETTAVQNRTLITFVLGRHVMKSMSVTWPMANAYIKLDTGP